MGVLTREGGRTAFRFLKAAEIDQLIKNAEVDKKDDEATSGSSATAGAASSYSA